MIENSQLTFISLREFFITVKSFNLKFIGEISYEKKLGKREECSKVGDSSA
jgi:hypothetical protein